MNKPITSSLVSSLTRALNRQGRCYVLSGANYVSSSYDATGVINLTVSARINPSALTSQHIIVDQSTGATGFSVRTNSSNFEAFGYNSAGNVMLQTSNNAVFSTSRDYHVVATYETNQIKLYIDGVLIDSTRSSSPTLDIIKEDSINNATLGRQADTAGQYFSGKIWDVNLWRVKTLNPIQINDLFHEGLGPFSPTFYFSQPPV